MKIQEVALIIANKLKYRDFTKGELLKTLNELDIKMNDNQLDQLISILEKQGFSYETAISDFDYNSVDNYTDDIAINNSITSLEERIEKKEDADIFRIGLRTSGGSSVTDDKIIELNTEEVLRKLTKAGLKYDYKTIYSHLKQTFDNNLELYSLAKSINYSDQKKLLNILCERFLSHQNYLISLVNVKASDAKLADLASTFQAKESSEKIQNNFSDKYPETEVIETQTKTQDVNNTLATAALNMAMEELGKNANPEAIRKRSLEILEEEKLNQPGKGSM